MENKQEGEKNTLEINFWKRNRVANDAWVVSQDNLGNYACDSSFPFSKILMWTLFGQWQLLLYYKHFSGGKKICSWSQNLKGYCEDKDAIARLWYELHTTYTYYFPNSSQCCICSGCFRKVKHCKVKCTNYRTYSLPLYHQLQSMKIWQMSRHVFGRFSATATLLHCQQVHVLCLESKKRPRPARALIAWWKSVLFWLSVSGLVFVDPICTSESWRAQTVLSCNDVFLFVCCYSSIHHTL